jgi:hypothetical protein
LGWPPAIGSGTGYPAKSLPPTTDDSWAGRFSRAASCGSLPGPDAVALVS